MIEGKYFAYYGFRKGEADNFNVRPVTLNEDWSLTDDYDEETNKVSKEKETIEEETVEIETSIVEETNQE